MSAAEGDQGAGPYPLIRTEETKEKEYCCATSAELNVKPLNNGMWLQS